MRSPSPGAPGPRSLALVMQYVNGSTLRQERRQPAEPNVPRFTQEVGRGLRTFTDVEGRVLTYSYDKAGRVTGTRRGRA